MKTPKFAPTCSARGFLNPFITGAMKDNGGQGGQDTEVRLVAVWQMLPAAWLTLPAAWLMLPAAWLILPAAWLMLLSQPCCMIDIAN
jgi:hypothetical protein